MLSTFSKVNYSSTITPSDRQTLQCHTFKQAALSFFDSLISQLSEPNYYSAMFTNKPKRKMIPLYKLHTGNFDKKELIKLLSKLGYIEVYFMQSSNNKRLMIKPTDFGLHRFNKAA